ncbi:Calcineurin-like phosphoesterase [compost metagenome]
MKILAIGDIVGEAGVRELKSKMSIIKQEHDIDFIIVNGENSAAGMGITEKNFNDILSVGTDVVTMGNHTWAKRDIFKFIDHPQIIRPANYPTGVFGKGYGVYESKNGKKIAVINLIGRVDINILSENPFLIGKQIVDELKSKVDIIIVDFHAEATAEKIAMVNYLDGEITALFGTHTHVQTADERILPNGTGYITDLGMTGPKNSVIGMEVSASIKRFETTLPERYKIAEGECILNGCIFELDDETCKVKNITRINM